MESINTASRHPAVEAALHHFRYDHLPEHLQTVSRLACELAHNMADTLPDDPQLTIGLHDLLRAKDCFVRVAVLAHQGETSTS